MKKLISLFTLALLTATTHAGEDKRGTAGFMFLKVPLSAREVSMGSAGLTVSRGADAMYWNPANVSLAESFEFTATYLNYFADISTQFAAIAFPVSEIGTFGLSLTYFDYGEIQRTTETQVSGLGTFSPFELSIGVTYSKQITDRVAGGLTLKLLRSDIAEVSASGYAFDFGFTYNTGFRGLKLGFAIQNIGPQVRYDGEGLLTLQTVNQGVNANEQAFLAFGSEPFDLPASVSFGLSGSLYHDEQNSLIGVIDQNVNSFQGSRTNFGAEYGFRQTFFLRVGYNTTWQRDLDARTGEASLAYFSAGAGLAVNISESGQARFDYGYLNLGEFGGTHRFTLVLGF